MSDTHEYRCLACEEATVARDFDVSHLSRTCDECGEFGRFVNTIVLDQLDELEADPPAELHWEHLERPQKFVIAERLTRHGYAIDDFDITVTTDDAESTDTTPDDEAAAEEQTAADPAAEEGTTADAVADDEAPADAATEEETAADATDE